MLDKEFEAKLRKLCLTYDSENGEYPGTAYEGFSIFEFYLETKEKRYFTDRIYSKRRLRWKSELTTCIHDVDVNVSVVKKCGSD